jgi:hypothetical protein
MSLPLFLLLASFSPAAEPVMPPRKLPTDVQEAAEEAAKPKSETPTILKLIIGPLKRGMVVRLPVIDTDPNRGTTYGVMPIWVLQEKNSDRIEYIHAPSLTYNKTFLWIPTYRFYYYPTNKSWLLLRGSASQQKERELMGHYNNNDFLGRNIDFETKLQFNVDGAKRFYGFGPDSPKRAETNYFEDYIQVFGRGAIPVVEGSHWKGHLGMNVLAFKLHPGRTPNLTPIDVEHPGVRPLHRQQSNEMTAGILYDSRDHAITTERGEYFSLYAGKAVRDFLSAYDYSRYGGDGRIFHPWKKGHVTAAQVAYEQLNNTAPFWLMPSLGGKYSLRAYGEGRYVARGVAVVNVEHRITFWEAKLAGVTTSFEVAPFTGVGSAFHSPRDAQSKHLRPVVGGAIRAVARPQVVGSIDVGYGQEGAKIFVDINYSF